MGRYESRSFYIYEITEMKVNKISRYGIVARSQHGQKRPYLKSQCIRSIRKSVSFSLRENCNESRQYFQVWDSSNITTWPADPQVLGDHVRNYTTEQSVSRMNNREQERSRSVSYMDNRNGKRRRNTYRIGL